MAFAIIQHAVYVRWRVAQARNALPAFFSLFAARFSIRLLVAFFLTSFLVSLALLISVFSD